MTEPLWTPSAERVAHARLSRFMAEASAAWGIDFADYAALHAWSIAEPAQFWRSMWDFAGIIGDGPGARIVIDGDRMPGARWFPDARLNYAENLLRRRDEADALVFWGEDRVRRRLSSAALQDQVSRMIQALAARGVHQGDRVAGYLPNMPETIVAALATASLGAVWSYLHPRLPGYSGQRVGRRLHPGQVGVAPLHQGMVGEGRQVEIPVP